MTTIYRTYKFRAYPNQEQQLRLLSWSNSCRFLWNLAHEQRLLGADRCKVDCKYTDAVKQKKEFTELRKDIDWLRDIPRHVADNVIDRLDAAWGMSFNKLCFRPKWKKSKSKVSLTEPDPLQFRLTAKGLKFPKLSLMRVVQHRKMEGLAKTCTILREGSRWYAAIQCQIEKEIIPHVNGQCQVGLDLGIRNFIADSNDTLVEGPRFKKSKLNALVRSQRKLARKVPGSCNWHKNVIKLNKLHYSIRSRRDDFLHKQSTHYSTNYGVVAVEDLNIKGMSRSYCGGAILDSAWGKFLTLVEYKLTALGGRFTKVDAKHTSQTCSSCGHVAKESRNKQLFCCVSCKYTSHADINAAKVILSRADRSALPVDGDLKSQTGRSGKVKLRKCRRSSKHHNQVLITKPSKSHCVHKSNKGNKMQKPTKKQLLDRLNHLEAGLNDLVSTLAAHEDTAALEEVQNLLDSAPSLEPVAKVVVVVEETAVDPEAPATE